MPTTALIIGQAELCRRLERQLDLLPDRPISIGWVTVSQGDTGAEEDDPILGQVNQLEAILAHRRPGIALLTLPSVMADLVQSIRTRLRRAGIADRFMPTLEDQIAGIGPRSVFSIDLNELLDRPPRAIDTDEIGEMLGGKRVLITGAGGSIGSEISRITARFDPAEVILVERSENALFEIDRQIARTQPQLIRRAVLHDIVKAPETLELFQSLKPQIIFHAAAHKHVPMMEEHPAAAVDNNLFGTKSVADAADRVGSERFVMISSDKAVNPSSIMGATKRLAEMYIQDLQPRSRTAFSMVRFGNVLGSSGSVIEIWSRQIADGGPVTVTDPRMTRYFMTIPEAASLVIQSAVLVEPDEEARVFVLNMGEPVRIVDLAARFAGLHGLRPIVDGETEVREPVGSGVIHIVFTGIRPGEKLFEELSRDMDALCATRHADIDIWHVPRPSPQHLDRVLKSLAGERRPSRSDKVGSLVRSLVPEMICPAAA